MSHSELIFSKRDAMSLAAPPAPQYSRGAEEVRSVIALVWQFEVQEGQNDAFESFYGADGAWTALSRRSRSFLGSSFLQDLARPERYLLVEYWSEMVVYERHHADFEDEVKELEQRREAIVTSVRPLGLFNALDTPERAGPTWSQRTGH